MLNSALLISNDLFCARLSLRDWPAACYNPAAGKMRHAMTRCIPLIIVMLSMAGPAWAGPPHSPDFTSSNLQQTFKIAHDLYASLDGRLQSRLNPDPLILRRVAQPFLLPDSPGQPGAGRLIISTGFISLLGYIAQAKAMDRVCPGSLEQYIHTLARAEAATNVPPPEAFTDAKFDTDAVRNEQAGLFNQMIGLTLALGFSQQYLAHCANHPSKAESAALPFNDYLQESEWDQSVLFATVNSLDCALTTDGPQVLVDVIRDMPTRPVWADYIAPHAIDLAQFQRQLTDYEYDYFHKDTRLRARLARAW